MSPVSGTDPWLSRRARAGAVGAVVTLLALPFVARLEIDNTLEVWLDRSAPAYRQYEEFEHLFGSEEFVLLVYPLKPVVELEDLERLVDLRFELEEIDGVRRVDDLARIYARLYGLRGIEEFNAALGNSPFLRHFLVSANRRWAATWVHVGAPSAASRGAVVARIEEALRRVPPVEAAPVYLAGSPVLDAELDRSSRRAARRFFPLVFMVSALVLLVLFRRLSGVVIPFVSVMTGVAWTLAAVALNGSTLNMVTIALPPLIWVLGLSTSIHLYSRWQLLLAGGASPGDACRRAVSELRRPCLYSAVTTAFGFASLMASSMGPVREMGAFAALGVLLCLVSNFLFFPPLIALRARFARLRPAVREDHPLLEAFVALSRRPGPSLGMSAVLALALAAGIPRLVAQADPISFFRDSAPIATTYRDVLPEFTGPYSLEITLRPPALSGEPRLAELELLDQLRAAIESRPGVARALSAADLVRRAHQESSGTYRLPETAAGLADAWLQIARHPEDLQAFVSDGVLRMSVLARPMGSTEHRRLVEDVGAELERLVDPAWQPRLTGIVPLLVDMQERLVSSQISTFALAFLMILAVLALLLRQPYYALLCMAPNLLPILVALGSMGWLGIPLDPATVMIAGIALGIAVDDAIHFFEHYRRSREAGGTNAAAIEAAIRAVGRPMVVTSLVTALGFLVLSFSEFVPLFYFGVLTAVTMGTALLGNLVVLPALLRIREPLSTRGLPKKMT